MGVVVFVAKQPAFLIKNLSNVTRSEMFTDEVMFTFANDILYLYLHL